METKELPVKNDVQTVKDKNVLSLFSGAGGMDLGFEGNFNVLTRSLNEEVNPHWKTEELDSKWSKLAPTKFSTVFANDILKPAQLAWQHYFKKFGIDGDRYNLNSIVNLVKDYENGINHFPENVDVITGGFPCQDFSVAGKRGGLNSHKSHEDKIVEAGAPSVESRGQLYIWMKKVVEILKPKVFIAENVKGLVNLGDVKEVIQNDFSSIGNNGYLVIPARILHSGNYGVPQSRERVFFIGFLCESLRDEAFIELSKENISKTFDPYPIQTHFLPMEPNNLFEIFDNRKKFVSVKEALVDLDEPDLSDDLAQQSFSKAKLYGKHCQGQSEVNLNGLGPTIPSEHHGNIEFRRLSKENGGKHIEELNKGLEQRRLTVRECARIQTFPDDYEFVWRKTRDKEGLSASTSYKLIGNAVPPLLGYHIAKRLEDNWKLYFGE